MGQGRRGDIKKMFFPETAGSAPGRTRGTAAAPKRLQGKEKSAILRLWKLTAQQSGGRRGTDIYT